MRKSINITADGTRVTIRVDRFTESFDTAFMEEDEIVDRVRWSLVTGSAPIANVMIQALLREIGILRP